MGASADDPFSVGLLKVKERFWNDWERQLHDIFPVWKEEMDHVRSKTAFAGALADTLRFDPFDDPDLREGFPPKLKRICQGRRDYSKLLKLLDSMLLHDFFKRWLSGVRDLIRRTFQDVFEIAAANSDRTRRDPEEFALEFLSELIDEAEGLFDEAGGLFCDKFLHCFFKERSARVSPAMALLRELLLTDLSFYLCELRSSAQIELAKRGWKKPKSLGQEHQFTPVPDQATIAVPAPAADQTSVAVAAPPSKADAAAAPPARRFSLADLDDPRLWKRQVVHDLYPDFCSAIKEARSWFDQETISGRTIGHSEIAERILLLKDSRPVERQEILEKPNVSVKNVAISIMAGRTGVDGRTIGTYVRKRLPRQ